MNNKKFKSGDLVELKSGSVRMTVDKYDPPTGTDVTCVWFHNDEFHEKSFPEVLLREWVPMDLGHTF